MHPIFRLVEDMRTRVPHDLVGDFLVTMRGQAMEHDRIRLGQIEQRAIDLEGTEHLLARLGLFFLTHARPHVGVEDVRPARGRLGIVLDADAIAGVLLGRVQKRRIQFVPFGACLLYTSDAADE